MPWTIACASVRPLDHLGRAPAYHAPDVAPPPGHPGIVHGVLMHPGLQATALKVAREELRKAITPIEPRMSQLMQPDINHPRTQGFESEPRV